MLFSKFLLESTSVDISWSNIDSDSWISCQKDLEEFFFLMDSCPDNIIPQWDHFSKTKIVHTNKLGLKDWYFGIYPCSKNASCILARHKNQSDSDVLLTPPSKIDFSELLPIVPEIDWRPNQITGDDYHAI